ncbi:MAG TPA: GGDEF domain-containing protein [Gemmatimonadaceae bacterium]|nr:GGDEF domain-containing protein [Gemmatimonadaceae bacterium]
MQAEQIIAFVSYVGVLVQLAGALLLVGLFWLLRRFVLRRAYFRAWTTAWTAMAVALAAVVLRSMLARPEVLEALPALRHVNLPLRGVYLYAKLMMLAWLVAGAVLYAGRRIGERMTLVSVVVAIYAVAALPLMRGGFRYVVLLQAPLLVIGLVGAAGLLVRLPEPRRTLGTWATAGGLLVMAAVWCTYPFAFVRPRGPVLAWVANYSSYIDLVCQMMLGYAMVVVLMEDAKREVDDAQAELRVAHDRLRRETLYDALTGALNRRAFADGVGLDLARASFGTVALLDLDNLKIVNDAHGHAGGDVLLRHLVEVLRNGLRASDKVYRWGGDEFLLIVPNAKAAEVQRRVTEMVQGAPPLVVDHDGASVRLEVSIGAVDFASGEELEQAITLADAGMYREKQRRKAARVTPAGAA